MSALRRILGAAAALFIIGPALAEARDLADMKPDEIAALQQRLTDAGCYRGAADGAAGPATAAAVKECPDQKPVLRIETGMHVAVINRIGVDRACRMAVTGSDDKTVRVWSLPDGALRLPIGAGNYGKVYVVALSPDGGTAAAGGWDAYVEQHHHEHAVTLVDPATGENLRRIGSFGNVIERLAFSPDGTRLAVALGGQQGVHVLDVGTGREIMADTDFADQSYGVAFGPDGSLYATGLDDFLRRYGPNLRRTAKVRTLQAQQPYAVAVDPTGTRLAVGYNNRPQIDLFDAATLKRTGSADTRDVGNGFLSSVAWTLAGRLMAGGEFQQQVGGQWMRMARTFDARGRRLGADAAVSVNTIMDLQPCGADLAFAAYDPSFGLLSAKGQVKILGQGRTADMRNKLGTDFTLSDSGTTISFGLGLGGRRPVRFDLAAGTLDDGAGDGGDLHPADVAGLSVDSWKNTYGPKLNGKPLTLEQYETSRSLAVRPDHDGFVLGAEYALRGFDAAGTQLWEQAGPGAAWGVNLARDGALIAAAYDDGTIRWHRWSDGRELLALFVDAPTKRWVAWTPKGYYKASPGGEDLIGWHINRGWSQPADFFPASKFRDTFARPDIVDKVLVTLDEDAAIEQADAARPQKTAPAAPVTDNLPPVLTIVSPADGTKIAGSVHIDYVVRSPSGLPVDAVEALINGRPASKARGFDRLDADRSLAQCLSQTRGFGRLEGGFQGCRGSIDVTPPPGQSEIGLLARAGEKSSVVAVVRLVRDEAPPSAEAKKPKLHALVVGISAYKNPDYRLGFPAKDAHDFADALVNQKGGLYGDVEIKILADGDATASAVQDGLDWLTHAVAPGDTGIIYLAGHGVLDDRDRFYFMAADSDVARLRSTAVPREDIADALNRLQGNALLFLDACHAGAVTESKIRRIDINGIVNAFSGGEHGVVTFAASTGNQVSQENIAWGKGAFTKAMVEGLGLPGARGKATFLPDGDITTSELDAYVKARVKVLTNGTQSPVMIRPGTVPDFSFATAGK